MTDPYRSALAAHRAGRLDAAEAGYRAVLSAAPDHADALHLLGLVLLQRGELASAEPCLRAAIRQRPDADFLNNLGILLQRSDRLPEAETAYRQALAQRPDRAEIRLNLCTVLRRQDRSPEHVLAECRRAVDSDAGHLGARNMLGLLLMETGVLDEARPQFEHVLRVRPDHLEACMNLAVAAARAEDLDGAERGFRAALKLDDKHAATLTNLGVLLRKRNRLLEAEPVLRRAVAADPSQSGAIVSLSYVLLGLGRYVEAWPLYESRSAPGQGAAHRALPDLPFPQWTGEPLEGRRLVLWPEQGFGDLIQFARYVPLLRERGLRQLTLVCAPAIAPLFEGVDGLDAVVSDPEHLPEHDLWSLIGSLPLRFGTTLDTVPPPARLRAAPDLVSSWRDKLPHASLRVGLVWRGSPSHGNDADRSLPRLEVLDPLWSTGACFVSLQKGEAEDEARAWAERGRLTDLGPLISNFADLAAVLSELDLVICVDTAVAHLAGTLGVPCWVLLSCFGGDWRWLQDRSDSPWYPETTRLFRQSRRGDWGPVMADVASALRARVAGVAPARS